jgi:hypothetical protein
MRRGTMWSATLVAAMAVLLLGGCTTATNADAGRAFGEGAREGSPSSSSPGRVAPADGTLSDAQKRIAVNLANALSASENFGGLSTSDTRCVAEHLVASLGSDDAESLIDDVDSNTVALGIDKAREAGAIVRGCTDYRVATTNSMIESGLTPRAATCLVAKLTNDELVLSSAMDFMDESDYEPAMAALDARAMTLIGECVPRAQLADMLAGTFENEEVFASLSHDEALCVANAILDTVGVEGMTKFGSSGLDRKTADSLAALMVRCANFRLVFARSIVAAAGARESTATCVAKVLTEDEARVLLALSMSRGDVAAYSSELGRKHSAEWVACGLAPGGTKTF